MNKGGLRRLWAKLSRDQPESYERKKYYKFGKVLGSGTFGEVKQALFTPTNEIVAVKIIKKATLNGDESMVLKEIHVVESLDYPHIVKLLDWFQSKDKYYLVFQLCTGGELFEKICELGNFSEKDAVPIIRIAFGTIEYLHSKNIVHRDIKPENFLFLNNEPGSPLMLADFGISRSLQHSDDILTTVCGSYGYTAPEILLRKGHSKPVDIWSLGIVTFSILCGYSPFWKYESITELLYAMENRLVEFDERYWWGISEEAKDFILKCLDPNPNTRLTAASALAHPWLSGAAVVSEHDILPNVRENFNPKAAFVSAVSKIRAMNRLKNAASFDKGQPSIDSFVSDTSDKSTDETTPPFVDSVENLQSSN